jgi:hypothetical protein
MSILIFDNVNRHSVYCTELWGGVAHPSSSIKGNVTPWILIFLAVDHNMLHYIPNPSPGLQINI